MYHIYDSTYVLNILAILWRLGDASAFGGEEQISELTNQSASSTSFSGGLSSETTQRIKANRLNEIWRWQY